MLTAFAAVAQARGEAGSPAAQPAARRCLTSHQAYLLTHQPAELCRPCASPQRHADRKRVQDSNEAAALWSGRSDCRVLNALPALQAWALTPCTAFWPPSALRICAQCQWRMRCRCWCWQQKRGLRRTLRWSRLAAAPSSAAFRGLSEAPAGRTGVEGCSSGEQAGLPGGGACMAPLHAS